LKLNHDEPVSNVAFKFKLRRYNVAVFLQADADRIEHLDRKLRAVVAGAYTRPLFGST
jgi:hypothetical protein